MQEEEKSGGAGFKVGTATTAGTGVLHFDNVKDYTTLNVTRRWEQERQAWLTKVTFLACDDSLVRRQRRARSLM